MTRILLWKSSAFILKAAHNNIVFTYHLIETRAGEFTPGSDPCAERYDFCLLSTSATPTKVTAAGAWRKLPWTHGRMSRKGAWSLVLCFSSTSSSGQSERCSAPTPEERWRNLMGVVWCFSNPHPLSDSDLPALSLVSAVSGLNSSGGGVHSPHSVSLVLRMHHVVSVLGHLWLFCYCHPQRAYNSPTLPISESHF